MTNVLLPEKLRELHLFAGAGGGILGGQLLGHTCVCAVEIEPYCRKVLLQRQRDGMLPQFPIWDDVRTFDGKPWRGLVDVVCGGFPCQDISSVGKGAGIDGERSGLWGEMARIIGEVRPRYVFVENSPALTFRGLGRVLGDLTEMGFDADWGVVGAHHVGAPHFRDRMWVSGTTVRHSEMRPVRSFGTVLDRQNPSTDATRQGSWWDSEPRLVGVGDDLADQMERLKAIGNGQVPAVAALAWRILSEQGGQ